MRDNTSCRTPTHPTQTPGQPSSQPESGNVCCTRLEAKHAAVKRQTQARIILAKLQQQLRVCVFVQNLV
jgi:hypothetical protein